MNAPLTSGDSIPTNESTPSGATSRRCICHEAGRCLLAECEACDDEECGLPWCRCCDVDGSHAHDDATCMHPCCRDGDDG